jgi:uncharacterized membrane protein
MKSKARVFNHPLHPMLVALPIGLWTFSFVADVIYLLWGQPHWRIVSAYSMAGGVAGALLAMLPGFIDYLAISEVKPRQIASVHMLINIVVTIVYAIDFCLRLKQDLEVAGFAFGLSICGIVLVSLSGWLGGELVYVHRVAVVEERERA